MRLRHCFLFLLSRIAVTPKWPSLMSSIQYSRSFSLRCSYSLGSLKCVLGFFIMQSTQGSQSESGELPVFGTHETDGNLGTTKLVVNKSVVAEINGFFSWRVVPRGVRLHVPVSKDHALHRGRA